MVSVSDEQFDRLNEFVGYGNPDGRYWFVGMEEGREPDLDLSFEIHIRTLWNAVEDVHDTRASLGLDMRGPHPTWRQMSRITMKMDGRSDWSDTTAVRDYKEKKLARAEGDPFITDLMPLPSPNTSAWPYSAPYDNCEDYYKKYGAERMEATRDFADRYRPSFIFCHGKLIRNRPYWEVLRALFPADYTPLLDGYMQVARFEFSTVILIPSFLAFDMKIHQLGKIVDALKEWMGRQ